ncbi:hypothetical protein F9B85_12030 [Heliorestis acidaminivorans]|uniref:Uncharacterized protein n=1 Tax=Heliorestis acidaminivorans TaxID=553427 RepID=A0A6I0EWK0_9FIRM|nr:hypothetical protein [Heliorestis acidaminivorans]KAB2951527.1 hypothetical protein F9B85_12030 [Heliorestis acidaminivorans]
MKTLKSSQVVVILIVSATIRIVKAGEFDQRFYRKWSKAKKQGFWITVVQETLRNFIIMIGVVSIGQFLATHFFSGLQFFDRHQPVAKKVNISLILSEMTKSVFVPFKA